MLSWKEQSQGWAGRKSAFFRKKLEQKNQVRRFWLLPHWSPDSACFFEEVKSLVGNKSPPECIRPLKTNAQRQTPASFVSAGDAGPCLGGAGRAGQKLVASGARGPAADLHHIGDSGAGQLGRAVNGLSEAVVKRLTRLVGRVNKHKNRALFPIQHVLLQGRRGGIEAAEDQLVVARGRQ